MFSETSLPLRGFYDQSIPNVFFRQKDDTGHLAVLFPGYGYTNQMPALYYIRQLLLDREADVLLVDYEYNKTPDYRQLPEMEQLRWVYGDAGAALDAGLAQRSYSRVTLVGKSLGTLAMGYLVDRKQDLPSPACVWLTPILDAEVLRAQILRSRPASLFVIGAADRFYHPHRLRELAEATGDRSVVIDGADHRLEVKGSALRSVEAVRTLVEKVDAFLGEGDVRSQG